ncbi:MAG: DUF2752 domain-containing protein [Lachnospiraceae bacterium]|nr:DUF2752 domain-containing protein [Lachnospiraceae bacterium]
MTKLITNLKLISTRLLADFRIYWWVFLLFAAFYFVIQIFFTASCPVYRIIGLPCAGCGMSRAMRFVLTGQFSRAYFLNPLAFGIVFFGFYCFFYRYIKGKTIPYFVHGIVAIFILLFLFYFIRMYLYFPERVPYVYNYNNTLEDFIPGYRAFVRRILRF